MCRRIYVWEELIGKLLEVIEIDEDIVVNVSGRLYKLPGFPRAMLDKLKEARGLVIAILRTDDGYLIRVVSEAKMAGAAGDRAL